MSSVQARIGLSQSAAKRESFLQFVELASDWFDRVNSRISCVVGDTASSTAMFELLDRFCGASEFKNSSFTLLPLTFPTALDQRR